MKGDSKTFASETNTITLERGVKHEDEHRSQVSEKDDCHHRFSKGGFRCWAWCRIPSPAVAHVAGRYDDDVIICDDVILL